MGINNLWTPEHGFYKADGYLRPGNSGGPAFDEAGQVVAIVQGGTMPGTDNNDLIPIALAVSLIKKRNVQAGIDAGVPYEDSCYSACPDVSHGTIGWKSEKPWGPVNIGHHNQTDECTKLIAAALAGQPNAQIEFLPDKQGKWEDHKKDVLGHVEYIFYCKGILRSGPIYATKQSPACPLKQ